MPLSATIFRPEKFKKKYIFQSEFSDGSEILREFRWQEKQTIYCDSRISILPHCYDYLSYIYDDIKQKKEEPSLIILFFSSCQHIKINPNFKILFFYWLTFKAELTFPH
jgi:hypothetical protein